MHFDITDEQRALAEGVRVLCAGRFPMAHVQALAESGAFDRDGWQELADAGVFALRRAERDGGVGLGMADAVLVFAELGRGLVPGPLIATHLAAGMVDADVVGLLVAGPADVVEHPDVLGCVLVLDDDGVRAVDPADLDAVRVARPLDPLTPVATVAEQRRGRSIGDASASGRLRLEGATLAGAFLLGIAEAVTERATAYAKEREQFDRPIGSFQAIKHLLADMVVRTEVTRAAVYAAGVHLDDPGVGDTARAVSTAKVLAGEAALRNAKAAVQIHGGMGFTWDVPIHLYLKRAAVLDTYFGTADDHAELLAARL